MRNAAKIGLAPRRGLPRGSIAPRRPGAQTARRHLASAAGMPQLFAPSPEHEMLRDMVRSFAEEQVDPQVRSRQVLPIA